MPDSSISVVPIGNKICKPFLLEVMVFSPEAGYKFKVIVERSCTPEADPIWKLVFDLYKVGEDKEVQVVHVSFTTGTPVEQKAVQLMASEGIKPAQADLVINEVHLAAKAIEGVKMPSTKQKQRLHDAMTEVVNVSVLLDLFYGYWIQTWLVPFQALTPSGLIPVTMGTSKD